jgi:hypothetical protein
VGRDQEYHCVNSRRRHVAVLFAKGPYYFVTPDKSPTFCLSLTLISQIRTSPSCVVASRSLLAEFHLR